MKKTTPLLLVVILLLASLSQVSDIYLSSLPFIANDFGVSENIIQLSLFYFLAGLAVTQLFYGPLSKVGHHTGS